MFVKLLTGKRAGEIQEMKYADAVPMLAEGRAVLAFPDPPAAPATPAELEIKSEASAKPRSGRKAEKAKK
jgi:hypothetical protein